MKTNRNCLNRNAIVSFFGLICLCVSVRSQGVVGIFLSEKDFQSRKLSFTKVQNSDCKIIMRSASPRRRIKIKCRKTINHLSKDSVYGCQDKSGTIYRFYKRVDYTLINPGEEIQFYQVQISNPTKYESAIISYYFSKDSKSVIFPLTIDNVLKAFSDNKPFSEMVELRYRYDNELMEFDIYHKKYKLNCLLEISKN